LFFKKIIVAKNFLSRDSNKPKIQQLGQKLKKNIAAKQPKQSHNNQNIALFEEFLVNSLLH
jgi:hypothetical protein